MDAFSILILVTCAACLAAAVAALVRSRRRADRLLFAAGAALAAVWLFAVGSVRVSPSPIVALGRAHVVAALAPVLLMVWFAVTRSLARAPEGTWSGSRRVALVALTAVVGVGCWAGATGRLVLTAARTDGGFTLLLTEAGRYAALGMIGVCLLSLFQLEVTARSSSRRALAGIKHALIGVGAALLYHLFVLATAALYSRVEVAHVAAGTAPVLAGVGLVAWSVVRSRSGDERIVVGRPVFYASVTAFFAGAYLFVLGAAGWIAQERGWGPSSATVVSIVFAAVLLLVVFLLSTRTRRAIRRFIDSNFYTNRYDHRREWRRTSRALSGLTREGEILERVVDLVRDTFDGGPVIGATFERGPANVSIRAHRGLTRSLADAVADVDLIAALGDAEGPLRVSGSMLDPRLGAWHGRHGDALFAGGYDLAVPLGSNGDVIGAILMSPRDVDWRGYTREDLLLLELIGRQAGGALLAARLTNDLAASREMASLHRVSSFVVHDLKNSATGLRLMARNAEEHISEPDFQRDLIRSVSDTADAIARVIERVAGGASHAAASGGGTLEQATRAAARRAGADAPGSGLRVELSGNGELPLGRFASEVETVLANLIGNAASAMRGEGRVVVRAAPAANGRIVVTVEDSGPGVPRDLAESGELFAPFARGSSPTADPESGGVWNEDHGLGIGLYQCRALLEGLGGGIEHVPGESGATFRFWLPRAERR